MPKKYRKNRDFDPSEDTSQPFPCDVCKQMKEKTTLYWLNKMLICPTCLPAYHSKLTDRNRKKKLNKRRKV